MGKYYTPQSATQSATQNDKAQVMFEKVAKYLSMSDIENELGYYISDKVEPGVRRAIKDEYDRSFALRHPVLTGIPTLGIAPAIAHDKAVKSISRRLARRDASIRDAYLKHQATRRAQRIEQERLQIERTKATQPALAAAALGSSYVQGQRERYNPTISTN